MQASYDPNTVAKMFWPFAFVIACIPVLAAPAYQCHKVGKPQSLVGQADESASLYGLRDGRLVVDKNTTDMFQFYACHPPSDDFKKCSSSYVGQLRSVAHPNKCLTPGNIALQKVREDTGTHLLYPKGTSGAIKLEDCSFNGDLMNRLQWFSLSKTSGPAEIKQVGLKTDADRSHIEGNDQLSALVESSEGQVLFYGSKNM